MEILQKFCLYLDKSVSQIAIWSTATFLWVADCTWHNTDAYSPMVTWAVKLETTQNQPNHPQIIQTTHKPSKPPTHHPQTSQTSHIPARNQPNHPQNERNYPQTSYKLAKPRIKYPKTPNYELKISFLCYQKLQRQFKTCAKFATTLCYYINVQ